MSTQSCIKSENSTCWGICSLILLLFYLNCSLNSIQIQIVGNLSRGFETRPWACETTQRPWFRPIRSSNGQDHRLTALRSQLNGQVCGVRAQNFAHVINLPRICAAGASGSTNSSASTIYIASDRTQNSVLWTIKSAAYSCNLQLRDNGQFTQPSRIKDANLYMYMKPPNRGCTSI
jgi:hypothetical protein